MQNNKTRTLVQGGVIAALYFVLGVLLAPISFGPVQCRIPEALTLLPVLAPATAWGITLGCALTNLLGANTGANFLGMADVFIGSGATLIAAMMTAKLGRYRWKGLPILASLPPVLVNAVVIGAEWSYVTTGSVAPLTVLPFAAMIGAGQLLSCTLLGCLLVLVLERGGVDKKLWPERVKK